MEKQDEGIIITEIAHEERKLGGGRENGAWVKTEYACEQEHMSKEEREREKEREKDQRTNGKCVNRAESTQTAWRVTKTMEDTEE